MVQGVDVSSSLNSVIVKGPPHVSPSAQLIAGQPCTGVLSMKNAFMVYNNPRLEPKKIGFRNGVPKALGVNACVQSPS